MTQRVRDAQTHEAQLKAARLAENTVKQKATNTQRPRTRQLRRKGTRFALYDDEALVTLRGDATTTTRTAGC